MLLTQFQTKFGFHDLEESEEITQQTFTVKPRSKVIYTLTWYEIWETGTIDVKTEKENKTVAFRVKTKLSHEIHSQTVACR